MVNFLDITMDLRTGILKPYMKDNDKPVYVNIKSNYPPKRGGPRPVAPSGGKMSVPKRG